MMKLIILLLLFPFSLAMAQGKTTVYFIPGLGTDYRIFTELELGDNYEVEYLHYFTPPKNTTMKTYAHLMAKQIDTTSKFIIVGASLGGMLATEMADFMSPEKTILIASAKSRLELPYMYRFQKVVPLQKLVPGKIIKSSTQFLRKIVEPAANKKNDFYTDMLNKKDPLFMKRAVDMIVNWKRTEYNSEIIHIHGNKDNTLPLRRVKPNYVIENGSHVMAYTKSKEISELFKTILL